MSTIRKLCNVCRAELRVPLEAQTVVCPACRNVNSYGHPATRQYINYANGPPGNMNANNHYHQGPFPSPPQRQPPLHASPRGPRQLSPRGAIGHGYYQPPPPPPPRPSNKVYYDQSLPLESLHPMRTTSHYQRPPQTSSPHGSPRPVDGNSYYQQAPQTSTPHGSPRPVHGNSAYYQQLPQTLSPQGSSRPTYTNDYYQLEATPPQRSPSPLRTTSVFRSPMQTTPPQGSTRPPHSTGYYQQPFQASSPQSSLRPMDSEDYYQLQASPRPTHNSGYYEQDSPPSEYIDVYYQQPSQAPSHLSSSSLGPSPRVSPPQVQSNGYYQQPLQTSPQGSTPQVQRPPHGSPPMVYTNDYHQQPSQALSHVPSSHVSPPRVDSSGYYQQPLQTSPHVSSPQMQTHRENGNGYYQPPLRTSPQVSLQSAVQEVSPPPARANSYHQQQSPHTNSPHVQISPQVSNPPKYGRKRAVICGVSYRGQKSSLDSSINDAIAMKDFLVHRMRFPDSSIILLTEHEVDPSRIPTKGNMQMALSWLVEGCQPGDSLVFYYSGHGSRERDFDGDEIDGFDEVLCPVDYKTAGKITDDEINATIVRPLPQGVKLHAIIDTCFSGSIIDLPFMCRMNRKGETTWEDQRIQYAEYKGTSGGIAISISACDDHQKSGATTAFTGNSASALTYRFIQTLTKEPKLTYGRLLKSMRNKSTEAQERLGQPPQEPQLSSSEKFDIHSKPIIL